MNKRKIIKTASISLLMATMLGASYLLYQNDKQNFIQDNDSSELIHDIKSNGIKVKNLSTSNLANGVIRKVMSYEITPETANNKNVELSIVYKETDEDASDVISGKVNPISQTLTFYCYHDFDTRIAAKITSCDNPEITAMIMFDYEQKIKGCEEGENSFAVSDDLDLTVSKEFNLPTIVNMAYYKYTVEKNYTFTLNKDDCVFSYNFTTKYPDVELHCFNGFFNMLIEKISYQKDTPSTEEIYNSVDEQYRSEWVSYLLNNPFNQTTPLTFEYSFTCNETGIDYTGSTTMIFYSGDEIIKYVEHVSGIQLEYTSIIF